MKSGGNVEYRTEAVSSGVRNLVDMITFEICELGNTDILEYCQSRYELSEDLYYRIQEFPQEKDQFEECTSVFQELDLDKIQVRIGILVRELLDEISKDQKLRYGLWLTSLKVVTDVYLRDIPAEILGFEISNFVLSDLGYDGRLYAYSKMPKPVEVITVNQI